MICWLHFHFHFTWILSGVIPTWDYTSSRIIGKRYQFLRFMNMFKSPFILSCMTKVFLTYLCFSTSSVFVMFCNSMRMVSWLASIPDNVFSSWLTLHITQCTSSEGTIESGTSTWWDPAISIVQCECAVSMFKTSS